MIGIGKILGQANNNINMENKHHHQHKWRVVMEPEWGKTKENIRGHMITTNRIKKPRVT